MFSTAALLALLVAMPVLSQQTIASRDGLTTWNCPTRQTIEIAYYGYCAAEDQGSPPRPLSGTYAQVQYSNVPQSYQTNADDLYLLCSYGTGRERECGYLAGGGQSLSKYEGPVDCPQLSSNVPKPSGGGNYRRSLAGRATVGPGPRFVCPWTSQGSPYVRTATVAGGTYSSSGQSIFYRCFLAGGQGCFYTQTPDGTVTFSGADEDGDAPLDCPQTLCDAIIDGTGNMRRGLPSNPEIDKRQVNTQSLRERLAAQRRVERAGGI